MTNSEAIAILKATVPNRINGDAFDLAIKALEKQIPKKPIHTVNATKHDVYTCECGELLRVETRGTFKGRKVKYCRNCGQAIDWSEE